MRLDPYLESWLSLATTPSDYRGLFIAKAASEITSQCPHGAGWEARWELLRSAMNRYDVEAVRRFAQDWGCKDHAVTALVTMFTPGEHYHVAALERKYDTLTAAIEAIEKAGMNYGGLRKVGV